MINKKNNLIKRKTAAILSRKSKQLFFFKGTKVKLIKSFSFIDLEFKLPTLRTATFILPILSTFKKLVNYQDLPVFYSLGKFSLLRHDAKFYGINFQANLFNYNL